MDIETPSGTVQILYTMTLGELSISFGLTLILVFLLLRWILDTIWSVRRKP